MFVDVFKDTPTSRLCSYMKKKPTRLHERVPAKRLEECLLKENSNLSHKKICLFNIQKCRFASRLCSKSIHIVG